jgi:predicted transglutaminase-like cysteine proteinase
LHLDRPRYARTRERATLDGVVGRDRDRAVDLDRRFVVAALASLAAACAGPGVASRTGLSGAIERGEVPSSVVTLGRAYLERAPAEADRDVLRRALGITDVAEPEPKRLERINAAINAEIEAGTFVDIAGWQLALTECRLYALAALSSRGPRLRT